MTLIKELERSKKELQALTEVSKVLTSPLELNELLVKLLDRLAEVLDPVDIGIIMMWDPSSSLFRPRAVYGLEPESINNLHNLPGGAIPGKVYKGEEVRLLVNLEKTEAEIDDILPENRNILNETLCTAPLLHSAVAVPIRANGQTFGVLILGSMRGTNEFDEKDLPLIQTISDLIAMAIDRDRSELEAEEIQEEMQTERLRSEILATLSHELRTPLAAIKGYATALQIDEIDWSYEKQQEFLHLVEQECENLETMIGDMLESSLIDVGQLLIEYQPVKLDTLSKEIREEVQIYTDTHRILLDFPKDFPIIDADPRRVIQVMRNILDNAIKYSPDGGLIVIRGRVRSTDVVISISDQGVGISAEDLIPLFDKYFRVKAPTGYHVAGTGLGLPIARSIIEAHRGRIWAESEVGQGTTLHFSLPREVEI
ncbi:MAG: GAF domain-containing protein [Anaerolineales bacterium]|nr:GAF domain-containing protein [Anaerolineales bacterium]